MSQTVFLTKYPVHEALSVQHPNKPAHGWDINSPIFRHRATMNLFPEIADKHPRAAANILFRIDSVAGLPPYFLIQSDIEPNASYPLETKEVDLLTPATGVHVAFRLAVNAIKRKNGKQGKGITSIPFDGDIEAPQWLPRMSDWLAQKLSPALSDVTIMNHQRQTLGASRYGPSKNTSFSVQVDTVDGFAQVQDSSRLEELLLHGVGRAKSYGCGLLSIRPLKN